MKKIVGFALLAGLLALSGCRTTAQKYIDENSGGHFIVKGEIIKVTRLTSTQWEPLADGYRFRVDPEGCSVTVNQIIGGDKTKKTTFNLVDGDTIIWADDFDYVLSTLEQKQGSTGTPEPETDGEDEGEGDGDGDGE